MESVERELSWVLDSPMFFSASSATAAEIEESPQPQIHLPGPIVAPNNFLQLSSADSSALLPTEKMRFECLQRLKQELPGLASGRLGLRFELFLHCVLKTRFGEQNVLTRRPVREKYLDGSEKTWGEFDFLIRDVEKGTIEHWESSIKFYLQVKDSSAWKWCWGPGVKDRLDLKGRKTFLQQLPLSSTELGQKSIPDDWKKFPLLKRVFAKGTIFYRWTPAVEDFRNTLSRIVIPNSLAVDHLKSWWILPEHFSALRQSFGDFKVAATPRRHWMTGLPVETINSGSLESFEAFGKNLAQRLTEASLRQECLHVGFYEQGKNVRLVEAGFVAGQHFVEAMQEI
ncbi:DUF1853 family protein [bacterium]|nr:DUF1853 family protein [bacterium]